MKKICLIFVFLPVFYFCKSQSIPQDSLYLGQTPPNNNRQLFNLTPESGYFAAEKIAISPDGKEIYYEEANSSWTSFKLKYYKYYNNRWNGPFNLFNDFYCLSFSPIGNLMFFENNSYNDCWISNKQDTVWGLPSRFLSNFAVHSLNLTNLGIYYFSSNIVGGLGQRDICKLIINNSDTTVFGLGLPLNSTALDGDFFISKDESYIILLSKRPGGYGNADLYISYRKSFTDNKWTNPKNLGSSINTSGDDFGPYVTADNKYLFYESGYSGPSSIYWIKIDELIDSLRYTNFIPYIKNTIPNQLDTVGQALSYTIPDSTFIDDDGNNTLSYSVKLTNGNPLPSWITFDSISHRFYGMPITTEILNIKVTVTDNAGASIYTTFKIIIKEPTVSVKELHRNCEEYNIFPNPTKGIINITSNTFSETNTTVEICDILGKVVLKDNFTNNINIDMTTKPKGIYLVKLYMDKKIVIRKISLE